jgi:o-succinylbenzoate---CoA ligase
LRVSERSTCPVHFHALRAPGAPALVHGDLHWTYAELDEQTGAWAERLRSRQVGPGDRLAVLSRNRAELVPMFHAAGRMGAVWVPLNARLTALEIARLVERLRPQAIFAEEELMDRAPGAEPLERIARAPAPLSQTPAEITADRTSVRAVLFTSGTAGIPKGAELTFGNFEASADVSARNLGGDSRQRWLGCLPLFHVGGLAMAHRCATYGACLVLHPAFDAAAVARDLARCGITHLSLVPTGLARLLDVFEGDAPTSLRAVLVGGGPMTPELASRARARGFPVLQTYGLTEACSQVSTERPSWADGHTAGHPLQGVRVRIALDGSDPAPLGVAGEIEVSGPTVMRGYLDDPEGTAVAFRHGWLRTADWGVMDAAGRLIVLTRRTDLILSGGENVYPAEVEAAIGSHPEVAEVAVAGVRDAEWGQVAIALCVPRHGGRAPDFSALEVWCRQRLAGFKVPKRFVAVDQLPKTALGKVDRVRARTLAELALSRTARWSGERNDAHARGDGLSGTSGADPRGGAGGGRG